MMENRSFPSNRRLPVGDEIFLDHVGHFVRDAAAASHALMRAGFAPTPTSIQVNPDPDGGAPRLTGTGNVTAMFARGYIEILFKTAETPLARQLDAGMARYPGVHLAAFAVADAADAHRRLAQSFRVQPLVEMQRPVEIDGAPGTAAFTLARVEPGEMPEGRIQILTHRTEHAVWQPRWLSHPNGALALAGLTIAVADIKEAAQRFVRFTGRASRPSTLGQVIELDRGQVNLVSSDTFAQIVPEIAIPSVPFAGTYDITVKSVTTVERLLAGAGLKTRRRSQGIVAIFPEELGQGAWVFSEGA
jgi:Glyoxalase-like domain